MEDNNYNKVKEIHGTEDRWHDEVESVLNESDTSVEEMIEDTDADLEKAAEKAGFDPETGFTYPDETSPDSFDILEGRVAEVAYIVWQSEGTVTPEDIGMKATSMKYSNIRPMTPQTAIEGLAALSQAGLVREPGMDIPEPEMEIPENEEIRPQGTTDYIDSTLDFEDIDFKTGKLEEEKIDYDPLEYDTGDRQQLKNPGDRGEAISNPARAFREIGRMQEEYEFGNSLGIL